MMFPTNAAQAVILAEGQAKRARMGNKNFATVGPVMTQGSVKIE